MQILVYFNLVWQFWKPFIPSYGHVRPCTETVLRLSEVLALTTFYNRSVKFDKFISLKNFFSRWLRQLLLPHRKCERESQGVWSINCFVWRGRQTTGANYFINGMEGTSVLTHGSREEQLNIKICNLFTYGTPRNSQEFVQKCSRSSEYMYACSQKLRDVGVRGLVLSCTCNQTHH